jgi:5-methylcytosine-specific restriction endonuclease McrA
MSAPGRPAFETKKKTTKFRAWKKKIFQQQLGKCLECGVSMIFPEHRMVIEDRSSVATVDHIVPLSEGGTNGYENFALICKSCNEKKDWEKRGRKSVRQYTSQMEFERIIEQCLGEGTYE